MAVEPAISESLVEADFEVTGTLREATGSAGQRKVILDLIVEGFGNQADNHYYTRDLLDRVAPQFEGADMFSDHLTREAEQKLGGLPRSWRDKVGRIRKVWTDVNEAGKRVLRGEAQIFDDQLWRLLEQAIDVVGVSINARGTAAPGTVEGKQARVVQDITKVKSVDVVAEAGAGGRVLALVEAAVETAIQEGAQMSRTETEVDEPERVDEPSEEEPPADGDDGGQEDDGGEDGDDVQEAAGGRACPDCGKINGATVTECKECGTPMHSGRRRRRVREGGSSSVREIAREAAREILAEAARPGEGVSPLTHPMGVASTWDDGTGYDDYEDDELHQGGDPIDTRRPRQGENAFLRLNEADEDVDDPDDPDDDVPGLPDDDEDALEAYIADVAEARARELAGQRLYEAVREGMEVVREEYDRRHEEALAEAKRDFDTRLAEELRVRDHRQIAASIIEAASLPLNSTIALKREFFDARFDTDDALRESVRTAVETRQREIGTFTHSTNGGGETTALQESQLDERRPAARRGSPRAEADESIERELAD